MKVTRFSMPSSLTEPLEVEDPRTGSDMVRLLGSCGFASMAGPARYLTTTKCPTQRVGDGLSTWLPPSYLTHLLAATLLVHTKLSLPEKFSLLLGASSS
jgi:hypothetical protein